MLVKVSNKRVMENVANKQEVSVNENEYALLSLLSQRSTLAKSEVVEFVWGSRGIIVTDSSYYQLLHSLRCKLKALGLHDAIRTMPRRGLQAHFRVELVDVMPIPVNGWQAVQILENW